MICSTPTKQRVHKYLEDVLDGSIVAGKLAIAACKRHLADLERIGNADFPYYFDENEADDMCSFFPMALRHSKGSKFAGHPFHLEPWQLFIVWSIYGWKRTADDTRRFRYAHLSFGRKNGKSTLAAGFALIGLVMDREPGSEIYIAATKKDQAKCVFDEAVRMRTSNESLKGMVKSHINRLFVPETNSFCCTTASDKPLDGPNPHYVIFDELHAWRKQHRKYYDTMVTGSASRTQPLQIEITTYGDDQSEIWLETLQLCKSIALGSVVDESKFVFIAAIDDEDDPFSQDCWIKANPNLGISVSLDYLQQQATDAKNKPSFYKTFLSKHMQRITSSSQKAIEKEVWDAARGELSDWSQADAIGLGIDVGARDDFAAYGTCARFFVGEETIVDEKEGEKVVPIYRYEVKAKAYMASDTVRDLTVEPFAGWIYNEQMHSAQQPLIKMRTDILHDMEENGITTAAYDPSNAKLLAEEIIASGFQAASMAQKAYMFNEPIREFLHLLKIGRIRHDGHPVLAWMATNAIIVKDADDKWRFDKGNSSDKIDMIVATVMAFRVCCLAQSRYLSAPQVLF
jgi:phage terminase large subunit-like protein